MCGRVLNIIAHSDNFVILFKFKCSTDDYRASLYPFACVHMISCRLKK